MINFCQISQVGISHKKVAWDYNWGQYNQGESCVTEKKKRKKILFYSAVLS